MSFTQNHKICQFPANFFWALDIPQTIPLEISPEISIRIFMGNPGISHMRTLFLHKNAVLGISNFDHSGISEGFKILEKREICKKRETSLTGN